MQVYYRISPSNNPHVTLAEEEAILNHIAPGEIVMHLYTHTDSIIVGKNQNVWAECKHEKLHADGGLLARRISGGGAVFHDMHNLNFSFIVDREAYDLHRQLKVILDAVQTFGIDAAFSGRNDILADGRKFSGNAFCYRKNGAFHHGTILINTDMQKLAQYLEVPKEKIESKGIASVRSRVVNLCELAPELTPQKMEEALIRSFCAEYGEVKPLDFTPELEAETQRLAERNASWDWRFGQSPQFDITIKTRFDWGGIELLLSLKDAAITQAQLYSDGMDADFLAALPETLVGCTFRADALCERLRCIPVNEEQRKMIDDLCAYFMDKGY